MTTLEPPTTPDQEAWLVYADWLADQDRTEEERRARAIARGIEATGGKLWLYYGSYFSFLHDISPEEDMEEGPHISEQGQSNYWWISTSSYDIDPISPDQYPRSFSVCPDVAAAFWTKLEEIGREES